MSTSVSTPAGYSVLVLTLNEERNLPHCLGSITSCDDIVVLDSGSTDRTRSIAESSGARFEVHGFRNFAAQRNHAQRRITFRHPWVFHLDADEQMTPALDAECRAHAGRMDVDGFYVAPRMLWEGRWIRRCTDFPAWQARFVRAPEFEFVEVGHGQREAPHMRMSYLQANYLHDLSSGGEQEWLEKHRRYARAEAAHLLGDTSRGSWRGLLSPDHLQRRRAAKRLAYALPGRPALRFVYQYLLRGGFLDGKSGLRYCRLLARYEMFTNAELKRLRSPI